MVVTAPSRITSANNAAVRPRASRAARTAAPSKTYAARASSASTVTATTNSSTGATRSVTLTAPETGGAWSAGQGAEQGGGEPHPDDASLVGDELAGRSRRQPAVEESPGSTGQGGR